MVASGESQISKRLLLIRVHPWQAGGIVSSMPGLETQRRRVAGKQRLCYGREGVITQFNNRFTMPFFSLPKKLLRRTARRYCQKKECNLSQLF